jgi:hypothetical protein
MKMVKSLLLGSAATFVAAAGAQAADLPMKAKAVEYVKVCSLYGAGYYYIPGTDTCIKIGGFVRAETSINGLPSGAGPIIAAADNRFNDAETRYYAMRTRYNVSLDVRTQTEYGTLRSYIRSGMQYTTGAAPSSQGDLTGRPDDGVIHFDRAFIQFAGFTFGKTISIFDFYSGVGVQNVSLIGYADSGAGYNLAAYTAQLGNGVSLSVEAMDPSTARRLNIYNPNQGTAGAAPLAWGVAGTNAYGGTEIPDISASLRVDQAWGSAQIAGVAHQVRPVYYGTTATGTTDNGRPDDKWGWAVMAGADINLPWAKGDRFIIQGTYTEGVMGAIFKNGGSAVGLWQDSSATSTTLGYIVDATFSGTTPATGTSLQLTTGWGAVAAIEHYWVPNLRTSLVGTYAAIRYPGASTVLGTGAGNICAGFPVSGVANSANCNPDLNVWQVGSRTVWTVVPNLDLSVEGFYTRIDQNHVGTTTLVAGAMPAGTRTLVDDGVWSFNFRVQRNFWP